MRPADRTTTHFCNAWLRARCARACLNRGANKSRWENGTEVLKNDAYLAFARRRATTTAALATSTEESEHADAERRRGHRGANDYRSQRIGIGHVCRRAGVRFRNPGSTCGLDYSSVPARALQLCAWHGGCLARSDTATRPYCRSQMRLRPHMRAQSRRDTSVACERAEASTNRGFPGSDRGDRAPDAILEDLRSMGLILKNHLRPNDNGTQLRERGV